MLDCHIVLNCDVVLASENKNKFTRKNLLRWKRECRQQQRTIRWRQCVHRLASIAAFRPCNLCRCANAGV